MAEVDEKSKKDESQAEPESDLSPEVSEAIALVEEADPASPLGSLLHSPGGRQSLLKLVTQVVSVSERHSGPLPPPHQLQEYENILPGSAERIFRIAEREQAHRHEMQHTEMGLRSEAVDHVKSREKHGQFIGAILSLGVLALSTYLASEKQYWLSVALTTANLVAIAGVFALGRRKGSKPVEQSEDEI